MNLHYLCSRTRFAVSCSWVTWLRIALRGNSSSSVYMYLSTLVGFQQALLRGKSVSTNKLCIGLQFSVVTEQQARRAACPLWAIRLTISHQSRIGNNRPASHADTEIQKKWLVDRMRKGVGQHRRQFSLSPCIQSWPANRYVANQLPRSFSARSDEGCSVHSTLRKTTREHIHSV